MTETTCLTLPLPNGLTITLMIDADGNYASVASDGEVWGDGITLNTEACIRDFTEGVHYEWVAAGFCSICSEQMLEDGLVPDCRYAA